MIINDVIITIQARSIYSFSINNPSSFDKSYFSEFNWADEEIKPVMCELSGGKFLIALHSEDYYKFYYIIADTDLNSDTGSFEYTGSSYSQ